MNKYLQYLNAQVIRLEGNIGQDWFSKDYYSVLGACLAFVNMDLITNEEHENLLEKIAKFYY